MHTNEINNKYKKKTNKNRKHRGNNSNSRITTHAIHVIACVCVYLQGFQQLCCKHIYVKCNILLLFLCRQLSTILSVAQQKLTFSFFELS